MRHHEKKSRVLVADESNPSAHVPDPLTSAFVLGSNVLPDTLPLSVRASDRLADMLLVLQAIESDLSADDEGAALRWIEPTIRDVQATVSATLKLLAS